MDTLNSTAPKDPIKIRILEWKGRRLQGELNLWSWSVYVMAGGTWILTGSGRTTNRADALKSSHLWIEESIGHDALKCAGSDLRVKGSYYGFRLESDGGTTRIWAEEPQSYEIAKANNLGIKNPLTGFIGWFSFGIDEAENLIGAFHAITEAFKNTIE